MIDPESIISLMAVVEPGCCIGARTRVWQFASISRGAVIGEDCTVSPFALVDGSFIGDRCKVGSGVAMGPGFIVGNDVFLGPNVVFCNDAWPRADVEGFDAQALLEGHLVVIRIEDGASVGANVVILPGVTIGAEAMVAAGAVVDRDVPPRHLWTRDRGAVPITDPDGRRQRRMRGVRG